MLKRGLIALGLIIAVLLPTAGTVSANGNLYTVAPILPDNQDEGVGSYISVTPEGGSVDQTYEFLVTNKSTEAIDIKVNALNALTSPNGVIQYMTSVDEENAKLIDEDYQMDKYMTVDEDSFTLAGEESRVVKVAVKIDGVTGTVLGAIGVQGKEEGEFEESGDGQFRINNEINTIIGVAVNFGGYEEDNFVIGEPYVDMMPAYYAIRVPVTYDTNAIKKGASLKYEVFDVEGAKLFGIDEDKNYDFAPKTLANIPFPWEADEIKKGETYLVKGTITTYEDDGTEEVAATVRDVIDIDKEFTFTGEDKVTNNGGDGAGVPQLVKDNWYWWLLILIPVIGGVVYYVMRNKPKEYVLYSKNAEAESNLEDGGEMAKKLQEIKTAVNKDKLEYAHIYTRTEGGDKKVTYTHNRTEKTK